MNRTDHFNAVESRLSFLAFRIGLRGRLNILDFNIQCEEFYPRLLNYLFEWNLVNANRITQNYEGIDLIDSSNRIVAQVSATANKSKIDATLSKDLSKFSGYAFKFIPICVDASELKKKTYPNPHRLNFNPSSDIYDVKDLLSQFQGLDIDKQSIIVDFLSRELGNDIVSHRVESNLASVVILLAKEDWSHDNPLPETQAFEIEEKITHNKLNLARFIVDDYKLHCVRVDKIYQEFDRQGANKTLSVLNYMRAEYIKNKHAATADELFFRVVKQVQDRILVSANYKHMQTEELELCVNILVVDAFIRCKIFENPVKGGSNATA